MGAMIHEGILCKGTNVVQNLVSRISRFDNKLGFPSHIKVTISFSMCFDRHLVLATTLATPIIASHAIGTISFFLSMFLGVFLLGVVHIQS